MPNYLVSHVERVPNPGEPVSARTVIVNDAADQTAGLKEAARLLGTEEGVYALVALSNVTTKRVKKQATYTVEDV